MTQPVPYLDLHSQFKKIEAEIKDAIARVLSSSIFVLGPEVETFEKAFSQYIQTSNTIAVNNGTAALHLALKTLNIGAEDEVITTPFSFAASSWGISYVGAKPVYVDIDNRTFNIDPTKIEAAITPKTKAILIVHLYGQPCDMDPILSIARKYNLFVIEDAAQAHGAEYKGKRVGALGTIGIFSFYPTKNLGAYGEAGAVVTNDAKLAERARLLRNHGAKDRYYHEEIGFNYRMEAIQAAILNVKLKYLDQWNAARSKVAEKYNEPLGNVSSLQLPYIAPNVKSVHHLYSVLSPERESLRHYLTKNNIGHSVHYPIPLHLQKCYTYLGYKQGDLPVAEKSAAQVINLPIYPEMPMADIERVSDAIQQFVEAPTHN